LIDGEVYGECYEDSRTDMKEGKEEDIQLRHPWFDESFLLKGDESVFELVSLGLVVSLTSQRI
jgi:hypothetical protein